MGIQMLKVHWKGAKWLMLPVMVAAFGLPLMAGRAAWGRSYSVEGLQSQSAWSVVSESAAYSLTFPLLALVLGAVVGLTAWNWDHKIGHVYPLSLPISRWKYAMLKFGSGALLVGATSGVFFLGAGISSSLASLPVGLETYPGALSAHFFMASLTSYSLLFALAGGTIRTAVIVISTVTVMVFFGNSLAELASNFYGPLAGLDVPTLMFTFFVEGDGPLSIFSGNWMLIDV